MQLPYNWIKSLVDIDWPPEELALRLTLSGAEAEAKELFKGQLDNIVVGHITEIERVEGTDHLQKAIVDDGTEKLQVICGAPNAAQGQKIVFARIGAVLQGEFKIKKAKMRGVESYGMICSERELGLSEDHTGIIVLEDDAPLGKPIDEYLGLDDWTLELDLTPNRMDMLSAYGVARDLGCLSEKPVNRTEFKLTETDEKADEYIKVSIDDANACPRYTCRVIKNIKIGPSPWWIKQRLIFCGMRPINNVVDITNLVMMEYGHPLHAFDYAKIETREIVVRRALGKEKFSTLDGVEHELTPDVLMITDGKKSVATGGVMGGLDSEVTNETETVLLEAAYFNPVTIRRGRMKLGINSESSHRFERGCDPNIIPEVLDRAASLLAEFAGGEVLSGMVDCYPKVIKPNKIKLRPHRVNDLLGTKIPRERILKILRGLDMQVTDKEIVEVEVPTWQPEITREVDLIEEIIRIEGFDSLPDYDENKGPLRSKEFDDDIFRFDLRKALTSQGFDEIYGSYLADAGLLKEFSGDKPQLNILNPISDDLSVLQNSIGYSLLKAVANNVAKRNMNLQLFEIGKGFFPGEPPQEVEQIGMAISGNVDKVWYGGGERFDFHNLAGAIESLLTECRLPQLQFKLKNAIPFAEGISFDLLMGDKVIGQAGQVQKEIARKFEIKQDVYLATLDFKILLENRKGLPVFKPLPKFPAAPRDLALVIDDSVTAAELMQEIYEAGGPILEDVRIFDLYKGKQIEKGKKSIAFAFSFRASNRSLKSSEIQKAHENIAARLKDRFNAEIREG